MWDTLSLLLFSSLPLLLLLLLPCTSLFVLLVARGLLRMDAPSFGDTDTHGRGRAQVNGKVEAVQPDRCRGIRSPILPFNFNPTGQVCRACLIWAA